MILTTLQQQQWSSNGGGGRIVVTKKTSKKKKKEFLAKNATTRNNKKLFLQPTTLIKSDLEDHMQYLRNMKATPGNEPSYYADESGIVERDLTEDMIEVKDMYDPRIHLPNSPAHNNWKGYEAGTLLSKELIAYIAVRNRPITVAEYMKQALTHELYGYYTNPTSDDDDLWDDNEEDNDDENEFDNDWDLRSDEEENEEEEAIPSQQQQQQGNAAEADYIIGSRGDFVTAPEVSQIFGECLAVWYITQWTSVLAKPKKVQFVEVGPGKGTLMSDVLHSCFTLSEKSDDLMGMDVIEHIHFVETSPAMRKEQESKLKSMSLNHNDDTIDDSDDEEKKKWNVNFVFHNHGGNDDDTDDNNTDSGNDLSDTTINNTIHVHWHSTFSEFMLSKTGEEKHLPTFVVCQEFIDALPVHAFEKTKDGWRERMIDVAMDEEEKEDEENENSNENKKEEETAKPTTAAAATTTTTTTIVSRDKEDENKREEIKDKNENEVLKTRLRVVLSQDVSPACRTLLNVDDNGQFKEDASEVGSVCEVCPEGILLVQDIQNLFEKHNGGAALIIDYGSDKGSTDSLRGFQRHKQVSFLSSPGEIDVTADVDFVALKHAVNNNNNNQKNNESQQSSLLQNNYHAFGPVTQGNFLCSMGIVERVTDLIEKDETSDETAEELCVALERLITPEQMGERYKVLSIATKKDDIFEPPGFQ